MILNGDERCLLELTRLSIQENVTEARRNILDMYPVWSKGRSKASPF